MTPRALAATALVFVAVPSVAVGQSAPSTTYIAAEYALGSMKLKSGGLNTAGPHMNTGDDRTGGSQLGIKIGAGYGNRWRADIGYRHYFSRSFTTGSYAPPTPEFFYKTKVRASALMGSAYYDLIEAGRLRVYGGLGLGVSRVRLSTDDTVVQGSGSKTRFAWQLELGADYPLGQNLGLNFGVRYVDLGKTRIRLDEGDGHFSADLRSTELFVGVRHSF